MIIALAGRRVDAVDAKEQRFPLKNIDLVRERIRNMLRSQNAAVLVGSAACGADLLAMSEAGKLGLERKVVLPFDREKFRKTSVIDRPGGWGNLYDKVLDEVTKSGDLLVIHAKLGVEAYAEVNHGIVDKAVVLGRLRGHLVIAVLVWDGQSRGVADLTQEFGAYARKNGVNVVEVMTL